MEPVQSQCIQEFFPGSRHPGDIIVPSHKLLDLIPCILWYQPVPTGIHIIQITTDTVIIPVPCQRFPDIPQVAVPREEAGCHYTVVPCTQVLAVDVGIVGFPVVGVLVLIGGGTMDPLIPMTEVKPLSGL